MLCFVSETKLFVHPKQRGIKMKNLRMGLLLAALTATTPAWAWAQDDIYLGQPGYGGTGCPQGTVSATLSPDAKQLSILFDQFVAEAGRASGKTIDRKNCNVTIPVHVPQGFSVSIIQLDYRGFNSIPAGGMSQFNVEYFFAGSRGIRYTKSFYGPQDEDYLVRNTLEATGLVWSACGADVNLRVNTSVLAKTNYRKEQTMSTLDSIDVDSGMIYHLQWRRCR